MENMGDKHQLVLSEGMVQRTMQEYRTVIRSLFDTNSSEIVHNASLDHAAVILEEMVRRAKLSFFAIAQNLNEKAWNNAVVNALAEANRRGIDVELLVTEKDKGKLSHLKKWNATIVPCIKMVSDEIRKVEDPLPNFAVMDQKALRYEVNQARATAAFSANIPKYALPAFDWFLSLKAGARPLLSVL